MASSHPNCGEHGSSSPIRERENVYAAVDGSIMLEQFQDNRRIVANRSGQIGMYSNDGNSLCRAFPNQKKTKKE